MTDPQTPRRQREASTPRAGTAGAADPRQAAKSTGKASARATTRTTPGAARPASAAAATSTPKVAAKPTPKAAVGPTGKAAAKPSPKVAAKPTAKATATTKPTATAATRPTAAAATKPTAKAATKPTAKAATKPTAKTATKPATTPRGAAKATPKAAPKAPDKAAAATATLAARSTARVAPEANGAGPRINGRAAAVPVLVQPEQAPGKNGRAVNGHPYRVEPPSHKTDVWDERVADFLGFLRRRITGQYEVDDFGFDPELTAALVHPALRMLYRHYFRVDTTGAERLPEGGALVVANHSGTLPIDALMLSMAVHDETATHRNLRLLGADLVFRLPFVSELARKSGSTLACSADAERMLRTGEYVGVFPEGFKGIGKPYRERYKLQRFGRGGFVSAALRTGTPIVPAAIVGAEEIFPIIANVRPLARITGLPYVPVTPLFPWLGPLGMLPLPSKWLIEFGEPIETASYGGEADDPIVVFNLADQVRETIQHTLHSMLERRPDPFG